MNQLDVNGELETVIGCAVRYGLGRQTHIPAYVTSYIMKHIDSFSMCAKILMERDVRFYLADVVKESDKNYHVWEDFLNKLQENIKNF